jgi:hypothetical protein
LHHSPIERCMNSDRPRMACARWLALSLSLLVGCKSDEHYATIQKNCPSNDPCFDIIFLIASGGKWRWNGHGGGFYREINTFEIRLPGSSPSLEHYEFTRVHLKVDSPFEERVVMLPLINGYVDVDRHGETVVVNFGTSQGAFWANGTYPIRSR